MLASEISSVKRRHRHKSIVYANGKNTSWGSPERKASELMINAKKFASFLLASNAQLSLEYF